MVEEEPQGAVTIVQTGRKRMFGGQAVFDRDHDGTGLDGRHGGAGMLGLDAADDEAPAVDHQHARDGPGSVPRPVDPHADVGIALPAGHEPVFDLERLDAGDLGPERGQEFLESGPCRHRIGEVDGRQHLEHRRKLRIDHGYVPPGSVDYLGCMRMPASMRIDSAFMYELDSSSRASVANSVA